ncbi:MAG: HAMP domain-containing protein [Alphaproteobacteria bacterium]|nr:HAMP domain-containing protein [Alphaproteobacteria bacterium]
MNAISDFLSRLRMSGKLGLICALAVAGFAAVGGLIWFQDRILAEVRVVEGASIERKETLLRFDSEMLQLRRHEKDFLLRKDTRYSDMHAKSLLDARKSIDTLKHGIAGELSGKYAALDREFTTYNGVFTDVVKTQKEIGLTATDGKWFDMRTRAKAMEDALVALGVDALTVDLLQMRRNEKDYMLREQQADYDLFQKSAATLTAAIRTRAPSDKAAALLDNAKLYVASFESLVQSLRHRAQVVPGTSRAYAEIDKIVADIFKTEAAQAAERAAAVNARLASLRATIIVALVVIAAIVVLLAMLVAAATARPLVRITAEMTKLSEGNTDISVAATGRDEVADMARALIAFRDNLVRQRELEAQAKARQQADLERATKIARLTADFRGGVAGLLESSGTSVASLQDTAGDLTKISSDALQLAVAAASGANEASSNVQTVASATEELTASIAEISRQLASSTEAASRTSTLAQESEDRVRELSEVAKKIDSVVTLINTIASQTNLLALNATIEAARAGEAGKGFAVVANEVKTLASQTAKATSEIAAQVQTIQQRTDGVVDAMTAIGGAVRDISQMTAAVSAAVEEQSAATREIGRNVEQAAQGVEETNRAINGVRDAAERTGSSSGVVLGASRDVSDKNGELSRAVAAFLDSVQAA